jgi:hypothetical protein
LLPPDFWRILGFCELRLLGILGSSMLGVFRSVGHGGTFEVRCLLF